MNHTLDLLQLMHEGAVIITPNKRLSQQLLQTYDQRYRAGHPGPLAKPQCLPYEAFLHHLFNQITYRLAAQHHPIVLSEHQQRYLWRIILSEHQEHPVSTGLLDVIQDAWRRCIFWQIHAADPRLGQTTYTKRFQRWYQAFQHALTTRGAITAELIPQYIINAPFVISPTPMIWTCFDEFTPLQISLQQFLTQHHCPQLVDDYQDRDIQGYRFPASNQQEEYHQASAWALARLAQGEQHLAIVIPELHAQIQTVRSIFANYLPTDLYNLSYGEPLIEYSIVGTALQWLALDLHQVSAQQIRLLLQSPFISAGQAEFAARSQILQDNSIMKNMTVSWYDFLSNIRPFSPHLYACLQQLTPYPSVDSPYAWTVHFKERLHLLGFPGDSSIDSTTYQCLHRFYLLLDDLMSLNAVTANMRVEDAIQTLRELAANVVFQIQKPATPITILGILEASGCHFDSIWITGLTEHTLPSKTKFSPFLPINLQKILAMPHTSAQREFERAQWVLHRFGHACRTIVHSYPQTRDDQPQDPCTLIQHYPILLVPPILESKHIRVLEPYQEQYIHPPRIGERLSGGTALLAHQAKCPFQAFAAHRLKIRPAPSLTDGLDLMERGQILHRIMETLWLELRQHATLLQYTAPQLDALVSQRIRTALNAMSAKRPSSLSTLSHELEYERIKRLIYACLEWEKQREPFQIEALEATYEFNLAALPLQVRIDRLDQSNQHANKIVIDYKTSLPTSKSWLEERPESPQLLLYALLDPQINTLVFIQFKAGRITLHGLSEHLNTEPGIQSLKEHETWSDYQRYWTQQLTQLADEIHQGYCKPKPKRSSLCQQCAFPSLCRIGSDQS